MLSVKQLHILMYLPDKQDILWISYISEGPVTGWGYKREGMITNLPLYLAGKTKKLLEWTCVRGRLFTVPLVQPLLSMSQWFHCSIFPLEKQLKSNEMLRIPFSDSRNEIYKKRAVCSSYSAAEKKPEKRIYPVPADGKIYAQSLSVFIWSAGAINKQWSRKTT